MSVDAKLFVTCGKDKMFDVLDCVVSYMNIYTRERLDSYWSQNTDAEGRRAFLFDKKYKSQSELFTNGVSFTGYKPDAISIIFGDGSPSRRLLMMLTDCSCDYEDIYDGDKIIFSIGHWGSCDEIMQVVAKAVSGFGDVYYDHNDCDGQGFVKLT